MAKFRIEFIHEDNVQIHETDDRRNAKVAVIAALLLAKTHNLKNAFLNVFEDNVLQASGPIGVIDD